MTDQEQSNEQPPEQGYQFATEDRFMYPIYAGSRADLSQVNLNFLGLRFIKFKSEEYLSLFERVNIPGQQILSENLSATNHILVDDLTKFWFSHDLYVLVPKDLSSPVQEPTAWRLQHAFLTMFPSDFRIFALLRCVVLDKRYVAVNHFLISSEPPHRMQEDLYEGFLHFPDETLPEVNRFLPVFLEMFENVVYFRRAVVSYMNAFLQPQLEMAYIRLCISLECIINGKDELMYRIKRCSAILNGSTVEEARIIVDNIHKFYGLRSDIVHGSQYHEEQVSDYYPKLRSLISRTLIELVALNIPKLKILDKLLMETGFGGRASLSENYQPFKLDPKSTQVMLTPLKPYKRFDKDKD